MFPLSVVAVCFALGVGLTPATALADAVRDRQWQLDYLHITKAQQVSRGKGLTVAVLDTGVDATHPDLSGAVLQGHTFAGGPSDAREDSTGHGTAMASLIAGHGHGPGNRDGVLGIAPAAKILPVRVTNPNDYNTRALDQGIEWAADHGADIISVSLSDIDNPYVEDAVKHALGKGVVLIAGAGNTADGDHEVTWPARYPGVVAVSGIDQDGNFTSASVSGSQVALSAPATDIMAAGSGDTGPYATWTGTSNATAIVAGVAALIKASHPNIDAANIINRLIRTANDRGPRGRDPEYGYGVVDPIGALTQDVPEVRTNPLLKPTTSPRVSSRRTSASAASGAAQGGPLLLLSAILAIPVALAVVILAIARRRRRRVHTPAPPLPERAGGIRPRAPPRAK